MEPAVNVNLKTYVGGRGLYLGRAAAPAQLCFESRTSDDTMS